uniref:DUF4470 domain-containing protein n=1 Tax=Heterorhabditis bacteriophora TaxID=37862 RepID=A0A1I7XGP1_HETBA
MFRCGAVALGRMARLSTLRISSQSQPIRTQFSLSTTKYNMIFPRSFSSNASSNNDGKEDNGTTIAEEEDTLESAVIERNDLVRFCTMFIYLMFLQFVFWKKQMRTQSMILSINRSMDAEDVVQYNALFGQQINLLLHPSQNVIDNPVYLCDLVATLVQSTETDDLQNIMQEIKASFSTFLFCFIYTYKYNLVICSQHVPEHITIAVLYDYNTRVNNLALQIADQKDNESVKPVMVDENNLEKFVGRPKFTSDRMYQTTPPGLCIIDEGQFDCDHSYTTNNKLLKCFTCLVSVVEDNYSMAIIEEIIERSDVLATVEAIKKEGNILFGKGEWEGAADKYKNRFPLRSDYSKRIAEIQTKIAQRNEEMKKDMLAKLKGLGDMCLRPFGLSTDNFQMIPNGDGGYSISMKNVSNSSQDNQ